MFIIFRRWDFHQRSFCVGAMHRLAVVSQSLLREPFRIANCLCPFRPGVAVAVQRHALNAEADTVSLELGGAISGAHGLQIRRQRPGLRQCGKDFLVLRCFQWMKGRETGLFGCSHDIMEVRMTSALTPALSPRRGRIVRRSFENLYGWIGRTRIRKTSSNRKLFPLLGGEDKR